MKRGLAIFGISLGIALGIIVSRAFSLPSDPAVAVATTAISIDEAKVAEHLGEALRIKTVSYPEVAQRDYSHWLTFHRFLQRTFPMAHKVLTRKAVAQFSLLYTWPGTETSLKPMLFLAHQDVVPVAPETEKQWAQPPFSGKVADGYVWGRGSLDDKAGLMGLMEAIERLTADGYRPKRTLLFAFGHDEEVGGKNGAAAIAALLEARHTKIEAVFDEGGFISQGSIPGVKRPIGLVGVAEKGYVSVEMTAKAVGGHSSMPPPKTAIGQLAKAIALLEDHPLPAALRAPTREMLLALGPEMNFSKRLAFANLWLFEPLILGQLAASPPTNASIRTTTAPTIFQAGIKDNVLPPIARAVVNFRLMPGETSVTLAQHVRKTIQNDEITIQTQVHGEPSPVSDTHTQAYAQLRALIQSHFKEVLVVPFLTIAGTDTKHYMGLSSNIYRFLPLPLGTEDIPRIHGINERIGVADYAQSIRFYYDAVRMLSMN